MDTSRRTGWLKWWLLGYIALASTLVGSMFWVRQKVFAEYSSPEAIADWRNWQGDVAKSQTDPGPVERKVPKSDEPPALVLMRDFFGVSLGGAVFFTSILYWIMAWLVTGALTSNGPPNR